MRELKIQNKMISELQRLVETNINNKSISEIESISSRELKTSPCSYAGLDIALWDLES